MRKARTDNSAEPDTILKSISCMTSDIYDAVDTAIKPDREVKLKQLDKETADVREKTIRQSETSQGRAIKK